MKTRNYEPVYESPEARVIALSLEGVLCASGDDSFESYYGTDDYEELF